MTNTFRRKPTKIIQAEAVITHIYLSFFIVVWCAVLFNLGSKLVMYVQWALCYSIGEIV